MIWNPTFTPALFLGVMGYARFLISLCSLQIRPHYILSESLAQARVTGTLRAKTERKILITYSGLPSPPRAVNGKNVLIHFAEKNYQISLYNLF